MIDSFTVLLRETAHAVIPFLFRESVYAAALFPVILLVQWFLQKRTLPWRSGLWLLVFIRLLLPPDCSHSFSGSSLAVRWMQTHCHVSVHGRMADPSDSPSFFPESGTAPPSRLASSSRMTVQSVLFLFWTGGVLFLSIVYAVRLRRFRRTIRNGAPVLHHRANKLLSDWRRRFGIRREVRLIATAETVPPFTSGLVRPVVVLPQRLLDAACRSDMEAVIAHETAHVKRWDGLWIALQNLVQMVYFFHPIVWMAGNRLRVSRECACDGLVLSQNRIQRESYARALLNLIKMNTLGPDCVSLIPSFSSERNALFTRLKTMKGEHNMRGIHKIGTAGLLAGLAVFILPMKAATVSDSPKPAEAARPVAEEPDIEDASLDLQLIPPVKGGKILSGFGMRKDPLDGRMKLHRGVDIPEKEGAPVHAAADGLVQIAEFRADYGNLIEISHGDGMSTRYGQLDTLLVRPGMPVKQEQQIGTVGRTGRSTGPHLHFEVRIHGEAVDPELYLKSE